MQSGLWFYTVDDVTKYHSGQYTKTNAIGKPINNWVSQKASYELIHARLGHPGTKVMSLIYCHVNGMLMYVYCYFINVIHV